jgi:hypothetical protein
MLNPSLYYTTFCLKLHLFKWGASATLVFISTIKNATSVQLVMILKK